MLARRLALLCFATLVACGNPTPKPTLPPPRNDDVAAKPAPPPVPPPIDAAAQPLPLWPEVHKGKLPNGLTYYILKHGKPEHRALLWLAVNAGSVDEDDDQRGLAHLDEHMAFNGTKRFPKDALIQYLEKIGMRFGADLNAYTTWQQTVYQLEVPTDNDTYVGKGLDILRDWAGDVTYDPKEVEKERGVVMEEWRLGRGAGMRLFDKQAAVLFKGSRYADRITIGKPEIIAHAPRDVLHRFYKDWYRPDLMAVIAVGDVDPAKLAAEIEQRFGDLKNPANERKKVRAGLPKADGTRVSIETDKETPATRVEIYNFVAHRAKASQKDLRRIVVEDVYQTIMNERLAKLRRRADAPFLGAFASIGSETREIDAFSRGAQAKDGKVEDTLRALFTEVLRVERHGFTQIELDRARTQIQRRFEEAEAREATVDSRLFTAEITRNFLEDEFMVGAKLEKELTLAILPKITVAELDADVKSFGSDANRVIAISGPEGKPLPSAERVLAIVGEVEKADVPAWEEKAVPTALMTTPPTPGKIVKEHKIDALAVTEWTLSNGARVIVKPTDYENDSVVLGASSPGGTALVKDKDYNDAQFAAEIANQVGGVGEFDADTLGKMLAGKRVSVTTSIGETTEGVRATSSPRDLETMFQLLHLRVVAPRKDADQFAVWQANRAEQLANQERQPEYAYFASTQDALYKNNPRRSLAKPADVKKVDLDRALALYKDRFGDVSDFTFVIVGQVELDKLRPLVETYLASLPGKHRIEKEKDLGIRKPRGVVKKEWKLATEPKALVRIDVHGDESWTRDKERDMFILGRVLSIRLREVLREDMSGVYGVGAGGFVTRAPHQERTFTLQWGCEPGRVDELAAAAFAEIAKLATAPKRPVEKEDKAAKDKKDLPIDDDDLADYLAKVKETYVRERETAMRTNGFWIARLLESYRFGDDPTLVLDPSKMIARMTPANVRAAAKRYVDKKQYFEAVMLPRDDAAPAKATKPATP